MNTAQRVAPDILADLRKSRGANTLQAVCEVAREHFGTDLTDIYLESGRPPAYRFGFEIISDPQHLPVPDDFLDHYRHDLAADDSATKSYIAQRIDFPDGSSALCAFKFTPLHHSVAVRFTLTPLPAHPN